MVVDCLFSLFHSVGYFTWMAKIEIVLSKILYFGMRCCGTTNIRSCLSIFDRTEWINKPVGPCHNDRPPILFSHRGWKVSSLMRVHPIRSVCPPHASGWYEFVTINITKYRQCTVQVGMFLASCIDRFLFLCCDVLSLLCKRALCDVYAQMLADGGWGMEGGKATSRVSVFHTGSGISQILS